MEPRDRFVLNAGLCIEWSLSAKDLTTVRTKYNIILGFKGWCGYIYIVMPVRSIVQCLHSSDGIILTSRRYTDPHYRDLQIFGLQPRKYAIAPKNFTSVRLASNSGSSSTRVRHTLYVRAVIRITFSNLIADI